MDLNFLDNSSLWVGVSFIFFVILVSKPAYKQLVSNLDDKIAELSNSLIESKKLKNEAEELLKLQKEKQKDNDYLIKRIKEETQSQIKNIKKKVDKEIESNMLRKINSYDQISYQIENKLKNDLKQQIANDVITYTEERIKKKLSQKQNKKLIENSLEQIPKQLF